MTQTDDRLRAEEVLRKYWGHQAFRPGQIEIILDVLAGRDVLGVLPTGWGKSVCYQVPALLEDGLTLVISPLVALMADQVSSLTARRIPATFLNSTLTNAESERRWNDLFAGRYRMLYVAPERLKTEIFRARAERLRIVRIAVDEAHCVSEWGHDFRPDYLGIGAAREELGFPPLVAVTATATPPVRRDVTRLLGLRKPAVHVHGFDRPNLVWSVFGHHDKAGRIREILDGVPGAGIVYVSSRAGAESWANRLRAGGESVSVYHAGRPAAARAAAQEEWTTGQTRVMVATSAFGMGIDRADVRFVIHADLPSSMEAYYQEAGRAGRDGLTAHAVLLSAEGDAEAGLRRIEDDHPSSNDLRRVFEVVCSMASIAVGSASDEPIVPDLRRIADVTGFAFGRVRKAVDLIERQGVWTRHAVTDGQGLLRVSADPATLRAFADRLEGREAPSGTASALSTLASGLARRLPAEAFGTWWHVRPGELASRCGMDETDLESGLTMLQERNLLTWLAPGRADRYRLVAARPARLSVDAAAIRAVRRRAVSRFKALVSYAQTESCRRHALLAYFGEASPLRCGRCDHCLGRHRRFVALPEHEPVLLAMLQAVADGGYPEDAVAASRMAAWKRRALADWLAQSGFTEPDDTRRGPPSLTVEGRKRLVQSTRKP